MKIFFTFCFLTIVNWQLSYGQFTDDFADNNFTLNPAWSGDQDNFIVEAEQLKLRAPELASTSYLTTPSLAINNASWEFLVQMDFNPSSTNFCKVYLATDRANLSGSLNGYFVKIGNTTDEISLYRQDGATEIKIIDGTDKILDISTVKVRIKVLRDNTGNWQLFSDVNVTNLYALEGSVTDSTYVTSSFFGIHCKYTPTRSEEFYFDDFRVTGDAHTDKNAPLLKTIDITSGNQLELTFSENLDPLSVETTNFYADRGIGNPANAILLPDLKTVRLSFTVNFPNGIKCILTASGIRDTAGNVMARTDKDFLFFQSEAVIFKDIVITEIFADPTPKIGLPETEYIEILNRSVNPIDLSGYILTDGSSVSKFPSVILFPGEYGIVSASTTSEQFTSYGKAIGLTNFPTLNNNGDYLVLNASGGVTIDSVKYASFWYQDEDKKEGGWSLELIDPDNICGDGDNWAASEDASGGTPGKQNSIIANKPDNTGPKLLAAIPNTQSDVILTFNEKLDKTLPPTSQISIVPATEITSLSFSDSALTKVKLTLAQILASQITYQVTVQSLHDCAGNDIQSAFNRIDFGLPEPADSLDLIVNEILFNPHPTGVDFVEIYNNSSRYINLKEVMIATIKDDTITEVKSISPDDRLIKPSSYIVLTEDGNVLKGEYVGAREECFLQVEGMPSFNDDEGTVVLIDSVHTVIDQFQYNKSMHSVFIKEEEGVSLERIAFDKPTNDMQNWKSASSTSGFATPGYRNSNAARAAQQSESVKIAPEIFIPVSGQPDFTQIMYNFDQGGYMANVKIYDTQGREIKQLANNEVLGTEGFFRWDGDQNNGLKARVGYYVVAFEVFDTKGFVQTFRKRVVVATKF